MLNSFARRYGNSRITEAVACLLVIASASVGIAGPALARAPMLDAIRARGHINCGVGENTPGFSQVNGQGHWSGLEVEFCSAVAAAVFGNKENVKFLALQAADRFRALQDGDVDILLRTTAWTLSRDSEFDIRFVEVLFYDGQGFIVPRSHAVSSVLELSGASICVLPGGSGERAVAEFFTRTKMRYQLITSARWDDLVKAYMAGGCTALTGDVSSLAKERSRFPNASEHVVLGELITKEPLGAYVKSGDEDWFEVVRWTAMALVEAEELGITSANAATMENSNTMDVRRLFGQEANLGQSLGLARDWAAQIVRQVGNYGEIFERTLGHGSVFKLERGLNNLWTKGGLMYAAPFR